MSFFFPLPVKSSASLFFLVVQNFAALENCLSSSSMCRQSCASFFTPTFSGQAKTSFLEKNSCCPLLAMKKNSNPLFFLARQKRHSLALSWRKIEQIHFPSSPLTAPVIFSAVWLYVSAILGGCFVNGSIPLFYELTMECTYPIAEGIPMAVLTTSNHVASLLFLAAVMIPGIGKGRGNAGALLKESRLSRSVICDRTTLLGGGLTPTLTPSSGLPRVEFFMIHVSMCSNYLSVDFTYPGFRVAKQASYFHFLLCPFSLFILYDIPFFTLLCPLFISHDFSFSFFTSHFSLASLPQAPCG